MQQQFAANEKRRTPIVQPEENLADLLMEVRKAHTEEQVADEPEVAAIATPPVRYNDLFKHYIAYEAELGRIASRQQLFEASLFNTSLTETPSTAGIRRIADQAVKMMIRRAQTMFAPAGSTLEISEIDALEATGQERWNRHVGADSNLPVDLDKLWDHLEATYGGDAGKILGLQQLANTIVRELRLSDGDAVKRTSSAAVIQRRTWSVKKDYGCNKGMYELGSGSSTSLHQLFDALSCVFEHAEKFELADALKPARHGITGYSFAFKPRERISFPGLELVLFKETWEFRFSFEIAEVLMAFLGTYATHDSGR